jgi:hypothetical protein
LQIILCQQGMYVDVKLHSRLVLINRYTIVVIMLYI